MNDSKFKKLVNLYIDKEISARELSQLKEEIACNAQRRHEFNQFCKVHLAEKKIFLAEQRSAHGQNRKGGATAGGDRRRSPQTSQRLLMDAAAHVSGQGSADRPERSAQLACLKSPSVKFLPRRKRGAVQFLQYGGIAAGFTMILFFTGIAVKQSQTNLRLQANDNGSQAEFSEQSIKLYMASKHSTEPITVAVDEPTIPDNVLAPELVDGNASQPFAGFAAWMVGYEGPSGFSQESAFIDRGEADTIQGAQTLKVDLQPAQRYLNEFVPTDYNRESAERSGRRGGFSFSRAGMGVE
jgi:hypothetical protein